MTDKTVRYLSSSCNGRFEPKYYKLVINHGRVDRVDVLNRMKNKILITNQEIKVQPEDTFTDYSYSLWYI